MNKLYLLGVMVLATACMRPSDDDDDDDGRDTGAAGYGFGGGDGDGGGFGGGPDGDGDGLSDSDEEALGTDPDREDTDEDGHLDGAEVEANTDPLDDSDHPYTGGWDIGSCRNDLSGTGDSVGDVAHQFELADQFGDTVRLHDFCDKAVLLISGAFW